MLDMHHLGSGPVADVQQFTRPSTVTNTQWIAWTKPRNASMVHIFCVGGGGGGGTGFAGASGAVGRAGGGGGGSSAQTSLLIAAHLLPDRLFVQVGAGGTGGASAGVQAASGVLSLVSVDPRATTANNIVCASGAIAAAGGFSGNLSSPGGGGNAGTIATAASMPIGAGLGVANFIAGQVGVGGGNGANGTNQTLATTGSCAQGGSGGGGTSGADQAGGGVTAIANTLVSDSRPIASAVGGNSGSGGYTLRGTNGYLFSYGGMGGGAADAATGGQGGTGIYGSGGGGGGGGTTGGIGGNGGNGIVIITSW